MYTEAAKQNCQQSCRNLALDRPCRINCRGIYGLWYRLLDIDRLRLNRSLLVILLIHLRLGLPIILLIHLRLRLPIILLIHLRLRLLIILLANLLLRKLFSTKFTF